MEFLKELLGEELYNQVAEKINAHNGDEANKDKQIKIADLGSGDYVSKAKHDALQALLDGKTTELDTANGLIAELKKGTKGNEELQGKITGYETQVTELQKELQDTKVKSALKVALLSEKAIDVDYLTYLVEKQLSEKGETLELDENDNIKGWKDRIETLKTQYPNQFDTKGTKKQHEDNRLPDSENRQVEPQSLEEALRMQYEPNNN